MSPRVAVIIVNYNGGAYLARCLAALQAQTFTGFHAIVVDNASTDGSARLVREANDARITLLALAANVGFAAANNRGVAQAGECEFVVLLNPDAFAQPDWLAQMLAAAERHPEAGSFGCRMLDARSPHIVDGTGDGYHLSGRAFRRDHGRAAAQACAQEGEIAAPCAAAALYRRQAWDAAGGLDEAFFCYMEDVDLGLRLQLLGWTSWYVPQAVCLHVGSGITGRASRFSRYHGQRNLVWAFAKNMPAALFWPLLPLHVALNLFALAWFGVRGDFATALQAKRDALAGLPRVWRQRREVQAARRVPAGRIWALLDKRLWPGH